jgi:hypothetical protein
VVPDVSAALAEHFTARELPVDSPENRCDLEAFLKNVVAEVAPNVVDDDMAMKSLFKKTQVKFIFAEMFCAGRSSNLLTNF